MEEVVIQCSEFSQGWLLYAKPAHSTDQKCPTYTSLTNNSQIFIFTTYTHVLLGFTPHINTNIMLLRRDRRNLSIYEAQGYLMFSHILCHE